MLLDLIQNYGWNCSHLTIVQLAIFPLIPVLLYWQPRFCLCAMPKVWCDRSHSKLWVSNLVGIVLTWGCYLSINPGLTVYWQLWRSPEPWLDTNWRLEFFWVLIVFLERILQTLSLVLWWLRLLLSLCLCEEKKFAYQKRKAKVINGCMDGWMVRMMPVYRARWLRLLLSY